MGHFSFVFGLLVTIIQFSSTYAMEGSLISQGITYLIEQSPNDHNILTVRMGNIPAYGGAFMLRGRSSEVHSQVENLTCDGKLIKEDSPGSWSISKGSHDIHWQIRLKDAKEINIASQQSVKFDISILLSEASSLPRFENAEKPEILKISIPTLSTTYPEPGREKTIPLPNPSTPPLFILLNFTKIQSKEDNSIMLTYLLDEQKSHSLLPDMDAGIRGLEWLKKIAHINTKENFIVGWCKSYADSFSLSGATGDGVLLVEYLHNKDSSADKALMLYVVLHEAFHQLQTHYPEEPNWVKESLASYYGARAIEIAMPEEASTLMDRFQNGASHFPQELLTVQGEVERGNHSNYGAFYTKGVSFWVAVDKALRDQGDNLDAHLKDILLNMEYREDSAPLNLDKIIGLPLEVWASIYKQFLSSLVK